MFIDCHNHIGGRSGIPAENQTPKELLQKMSEAKVDKAVVFPFYHNAVDNNYSNANKFIHEACKKHPKRFIGFGRLDILSKTWGKEEKEIHELGLKGVKIFNREYPLKKAFPMFKKTGQHSLCLLIHTDYTALTHAKNIEILHDYPAPIIIGHSGKCHYHYAVDLAVKYDHMYLDISFLSIYRLRRVLEEAGPDKLLFGSDSPYSHPLVMKATLQHAGLTKSEYKKITYENFKKFFKGTGVKI